MWASEERKMKAQEDINVPKAATSRSFVLFQIVVMLRVGHWVKNGFVFAPLVFSGHYSNMVDVISTICAFVVFSVTASAIYIFNDIVDKERDALSELAKHRPIAAGTVPIAAAVGIATILIISALAWSFHIGYEFAVFVVLYIANNVGYSLLIKDKVIADVISIAVGFVIRVLAGASLIEVEPSQWLIVCTFSLALLLGFGKRRAELFHARGIKLVNTIYTAEKLDHMISVSAAITLLSYMLYVVSPESVHRFNGPLMLGTVPFVVYGIFRFVAKIQEGKCKDPVHLIYSDRVSVLNIMLWVLTVMTVLWRTYGL